mmetsp:Transcript_12439/g.43952  ORF Transcript_12439/g.43952 Transcript_12439/m.43952 type:complete len:258 (+) Transcript_12439:2481-3254(+)
MFQDGLRRRLAVVRVDVDQAVPPGGVATAAAVRLREEDEHDPRQHQQRGPSRRLVPLLPSRHEILLPERHGDNAIQQRTLTLPPLSHAPLARANRHHFCMGPTNQRVARQRLFRFKKAVDEARLHHRSVRRDGGATYMPPPSPPEKNASDSKRHRSCESVFSKNVNSRDSASAANSGSAISQINTCTRRLPKVGRIAAQRFAVRSTCAVAPMSLSHRSISMTQSLLGSVAAKALAQARSRRRKSSTASGASFPGLSR